MLPVRSAAWVGGDGSTFNSISWALRGDHAEATDPGRTATGTHHNRATRGFAGRSARRGARCGRLEGLTTRRSGPGRARPAPAHRTDTTSPSRRPTASRRTRPSRSHRATGHPPLRVAHRRLAYGSARPVSPPRAPARPAVQCLPLHPPASWTMVRLKDATGVRQRPGFGPVTLAASRPLRGAPSARQVMFRPRWRTFSRRPAGFAQALWRHACPRLYRGTGTHPHHSSHRLSWTRHALPCHSPHTVTLMTPGKR